MKANAPEKIYIPRLEGNKSFVHEWSATKFRKYFSREIAENVEYTRTDALIEKAADWLDKTLRNTDFYEDEIELFIKEFKKAMKL